MSQVGRKRQRKEVIQPCKNGSKGEKTQDQHKEEKRGKFNEPLSSNDMPFSSGICTMMRLPLFENADGLDACFVGAPIDHGTSYKPGARFGPRSIREESVLVRKYNIQTGADPFSSLQVADIGDLRVNLYDLKSCCILIKEQMKEIIKDGCRPLIIGGDHTISYPTLQAMAEKYGPVAMVHVDAHSDCSEHMGGEKIAHGTPFRRAIEENLLDCKKVFQIGIRGSVGTVNEFDYQIEKGFRIIPAKDYWYKSMKSLMNEVRETIGDAPTYMSFDIDSLDPSTAPGTGYREPGGLTTSQAIEIIRGCRGLNMVGVDFVEVSPPYDPTGLTSVTAAQLLFEILCILPGVHYHEKDDRKRNGE